MSASQAMRAGWAGVILSASLLSACGGGGSDGPAPIQGVAIPDNLAITAQATTDVASATAFSHSAAGTSGLTFSWNFGDGTSSTEASPKHDFAKVGDYEVVLKVSNAAGASKEVKFKVSVNNRAHVRGLTCNGVDDSGWCWQQPRPSGNQPSDFFFVDAQTGWSVGDNGEILKTSNAGTSWTRQATGVTTRLTQVRFADANQGWAIGEAGAVLRTSNGGTTWTLQEAGFTTGYTNTLTVLNARTALVYNGNGKIRVTEDGGATWAQRDFLLSTVGADGTLWGIDYNGVKKSTDLGRTVTNVSLGGSGLYGRLVLAGSRVVAMGQTSRYDSSTGQYLTTLETQTSADGGATWTAASLATPVNWYSADAVRYADENTLYLGSGLEVYRSADAGRNWTRLALPANTYSALDFRVLEGGLLFRRVQDNNYRMADYTSADGGANWTRVQAPFDTTYAYDVVPLRRIAANTWLAIYGGRAAVTSNGMQSWTQVASTSTSDPQKGFTGLWFFDTQRGLALNRAGELVQTANGGRDWTVKASGLTSTYSGLPMRMQFSSATKGWLLTGDGRIYRSTDAGASWSVPLVNYNQRFFAFHFVSDEQGFALATITPDSGYTYRTVLLASTDGGQSWTQRAEFSETVNAVAFGSATQGVVVGDGGRVMATSDGGKTWSNRFSGSTSYLRRVSFSEPGVAWAVGSAGTLLNSRDGGQTWTALKPGTTAEFQNVRFLDAQRGWVVGSGGTLLRTQDGGKTWLQQATGTQRHLNDVFFVDSRTGWLTNEEGAVLATGTGGE